MCSCAAFVKTMNVTECTMYITWAGKRPSYRSSLLLTQFYKAFAGLRAYALTSQNWFIGILVVLLGLVPFGTNMVRQTKISHQVVSV